MKTNFFIATLLSTLLLINSKAYSQIDTSFWFVAPDITTGSAYVLDSPISFKFITYNQGATVTIQMPANPGFTPQVLTLNADTITKFDLGPLLSQIKNAPANTVLNKGIYISSSIPISVYYDLETGYGSYQPRQDNPEACALKGQKALGTEFTIPGQTTLPGDSLRISPAPYAAFDIVSTEDSTDITITPAHPIAGRGTTTPFTIRLNKGQTFSVRAAYMAAGFHLNGSNISSTKPIAVTVKDDMMYGTNNGAICGDSGFDQILPHEWLGHHFIIINGDITAGFNQVFITAIDSNTQIYRDGILVATINKNQNYNFLLGNNKASLITSNKPVLVWHLNGYGCEMGLSFIGDSYCTGSRKFRYTKLTRQSLKILVAVPKGHEANFTINGITAFSLASFDTIPGTNGDWVFSSVSYNNSTIGTNFVIENSTSDFILNVLDGKDGHGTSFVTFGNINNNNPYTNCNESGCELDVKVEHDPEFNQGILIKTPGLGGYYYWDFGDGTTDTTTSTFVRHTYAICKEYTIKLKYVSVKGGKICEKVFKINPCKPSGILEKHRNNKLYIYPNPSRNNSIIKISGFSDDVETNNIITKIFSPDGKIVFEKREQSLINGELTIQLNNLSIGPYYIEVITSNPYILRQRFIISD